MKEFIIETWRQGQTFLLGHLSVGKIKKNNGHNIQCLQDVTYQQIMFQGKIKYKDNKHVFCTQSMTLIHFISKLEL